MPQLKVPSYKRGISKTGGEVESQLHSKGSYVCALAEESGGWECADRLRYQNTEVSLFLLSKVVRHRREVRFVGKERKFVGQSPTKGMRSLCFKQNRGTGLGGGGGRSEKHGGDIAGISG